MTKANKTAVKQIPARSSRGKTSLVNNIASPTIGKSKPSSPATGSSSAKSKAADVPACLECHGLIEKDTKALNCERCLSVWKCIDCLGLSDEEYDILTSPSACCLHWFCSGCEKSALSKEADSKIMEMLQKILEQSAEFTNQLKDKVDIARVVEMETRLKEIEKKMLSEGEEEVESKIPTSKKTIAQIVTEAVTNHSEEEKEIELRKNNIIVYRVPESTSDDVDTRTASDKSFISELCETGLEIGPMQDNINKAIRLGRKTEGKTRPLLIKLDSESAKSKIMTNLRRLRYAEEKFNKVSIAQDLTPAQRNAAKNALVAARENQVGQEGGVQGNLVYRVVGNPSKPRVVVVKRNN